MTTQNWLPGYTIINIPGVHGGAIVGGFADRIVLHRTEGSLTSAISTYIKDHNVPHFTADLANDYCPQHLPLTVSGTALMHDGVETNRAGHCIQIEIVGSSADNGLNDYEYNVLAKLLKDIVAAGVNVDLGNITQFHPYPPENGILLNGKEPWRMLPQAWATFNGVCGHQHVPLPNVHGDPGYLDAQKLITLVHNTTATVQEIDVPDSILTRDKTIATVWCTSAAGRWPVANPKQRDFLLWYGLVRPNWDANKNLITFGVFEMEPAEFNESVGKMPIIASPLSK